VCVCVWMRATEITVNEIFLKFLYFFSVIFSLIADKSVGIVLAVCPSSIVIYMFFCSQCLVSTILKFSIPYILVSVNTFQLYQLSAKCLFFTYIYCILSCMFRCHVHYHQEELLCHLLKTRYSYKAAKYGFYSSYVVNIL
jgi:hypothetical protein